MVVNRFRPILPAMMISILVVRGLRKQRSSLYILGVIFYSLRKVGLKAARSLGVVSWAGILYDCSCVLKSCFNAYVLSILEHCGLVWLSSAEFHLSLMDSVARRAERLCEDEFCCFGHRRKVVLCVCSIRLIKEWTTFAGVSVHFVAAYNSRASAALRELALVLPRCRTVQFSRSFLPVAVRLWNLLSDVFSGGSLSSFIRAMNLCLQRA